MSNFSKRRTFHEIDESFSSPTSDEKMDTGSESMLSTQDTPNSTLSSDFDADEKDTEDMTDKPSVLRLQNPDEDEPVTDNELSVKQKNIPKDLVNHNDSLVSKMLNLHIDSNEKTKPKLGVSPMRQSSILTIASDHPLKFLGSPDLEENYPDIVPTRKLEDISISSTEDDGNLQRNTSKNNLYFSENFSSMESSISTRISPPDVTRNNCKSKKRKIIPVFRENDLSININRKSIDTSTPQRVLGHGVEGSVTDSIEKYIHERNKRSFNSPQVVLNSDIIDLASPDNASAEENEQKSNDVIDLVTPEKERLSIDVNRSIDKSMMGVSDRIESPSQIRLLNFQIPIEMLSNIGSHEDLDSPEPKSSSTQEDKSTYQATLDPYTGNVSLKHTNTSSRSSGVRRFCPVMHIDTEDHDSVDSLSICSMDSEGEKNSIGHENVHIENEENSSLEIPVQNIETEKSIYEDAKENFDENNSPSTGSEQIAEYSAAEERRMERSRIDVLLSNGEYKSCDMRVIDPYKRVLSHGGYEKTGAAIIVLSACYFPDSSRRDYEYVMHNLFLYVIWTLQRLVTDDYILVYLHGSAEKRKIPTITWLSKYYQLIDRRLRKSLKNLYVVHPTIWIRGLFLMIKPFISTKFAKKLNYVKDLSELMEIVPVEPQAIPEYVRKFDENR